MTNSENEHFESFFNESDAPKPSKTMDRAYEKMSSSDTSDVLVADHEILQDLPSKSGKGSKDGTKTTLGHELLSWLKELLIAAVIVVLFMTFVAGNYSVQGSSMYPNLQEGDRVIINKLAYKFGEVSRGDVIVFKQKDEPKGHDRLIKRVVGLPGDEIIIMDGNVYINGYLYDESNYLNVRTDEGSISTIVYPYKVPEGCYFVLGDNRANSKDSRYFGAVAKEDIIGKELFRYWPLTEMRLAT